MINWSYTIVHLVHLFREQTNKREPYELYIRERERPFIKKSQNFTDKRFVQKTKKGLSCILCKNKQMC